MRLSLMWDRAGDAPAGWLRHIPVQWPDIEGARGQYGFDRVEAWLGKSAAPAFLAFQFATANRSRNELKDLTPAFHKRSLLLKSGGLTGEIPHYGDLGWRKALYGAIEGLAARYKNDPRVLGFFHGPGVNDESQPIQNWPGVDWAPSLTSQLSSANYYSFVEESTAVAVAAWAPKRVYLSAAPPPGWPWGARGKSCVVRALENGAGYRCCGLREDIVDAMGLGGHQGTGMYEIATKAPFCAFEGGLNDGTGQPAMRLYWMLLQAMCWGADHVNLQHGWIPAAKEVLPLLPTAGAWIVFRDYEYPPVMWGEYGKSGVPSPFGCELALENTWPAQPVFQPNSYGFDRWVLRTTQPFDLRTTLPAGEYEATIWRPDGCREPVRLRVEDGHVTVPAGAYHRIDMAGTVTPAEQPLTLEKRVARLEQLHGL